MAEISHWRVRVGDRDLGRFTTAQLQALVDLGKLDGDWLVADEPDGSWRRAALIDEFWNPPRSSQIKGGDKSRPDGASLAKAASGPRYPCDQLLDDVAQGAQPSEPRPNQANPANQYQPPPVVRPPRVSPNDASAALAPPQAPPAPIAPTVGPLFSQVTSTRGHAADFPAIKAPATSAGGRAAGSSSAASAGDPRIAALRWLSVLAVLGALTAMGLIVRSALIDSQNARSSAAATARPSQSANGSMSPASTPSSASANHPPGETSSDSAPVKGPPIDRFRWADASSQRVHVANWLELGVESAWRDPQSPAALHIAVVIRNRASDRPLTYIGWDRTAPHAASLSDAADAADPAQAPTPPNAADLDPPKRPDPTKETPDPQKKGRRVIQPGDSLRVALTFESPVEGDARLTLPREALGRAGNPFRFRIPAAMIGQSPTPQGGRLSAEMADESLDDEDLPAQIRRYKERQSTKDHASSPADKEATKDPPKSTSDPELEDAFKID